MVGILLTVGACGSDTGPSGKTQCTETEDWYYFDVLQPTDLCDPTWEACNACTPEAVCSGDTVEGQAATSGTVKIFGAYDGICTIPCATDADCAGLDIVSRRHYVETTQQWHCDPIGGRNLCAVTLEYDSGGGGGCNDACLSNCTVGESCIDLCCH